MKRTAYYRRLNGFPCTHPRDVQVSMRTQCTSPFDDAWQQMDVDPGDHASMTLSEGLNDVWLLVDALHIEAAIQRHLRMGTPERRGLDMWQPMSLEDLDDASDPDALEALCRAVRRAIGPKAAQAQAEALEGCNV